MKTALVAVFVFRFCIRYLYMAKSVLYMAKSVLYMVKS